MLTATSSRLARLACAVVAASLAAVTLAACSPDSPAASPSSCAPVTPAPNIDAVTAIIDLGDLVTLTAHDVADALVTAEGVSERSPGELADAVPAQLEGSPWEVIQIDDEGFDPRST